MLDEALAALVLELTRGMRAAIDAHARLLVAWNEAVNLTAISAPEAIALEHVADSLAAVPLLFDLAASRRAHGRGLGVLDVGSGGGYPGVPVAVALPATRAMLVDSIAKKAGFLATAATAAAEALRSSGEEAPMLSARAGRAESLARGPDRDRWDVVTARALAPLPLLLELALPLVRPGGVLVAWKRDAGDGRLAGEIAAAEPALAELGGAAGLEVHGVPIAGLEDHRLIVAGKRRATPAPFPRRIPGRRPLLP